jgi:hypothetical protein
MNQQYDKLFPAISADALDTQKLLKLLPMQEIRKNPAQTVKTVRKKGINYV